MKQIFQALLIHNIFEYFFKQTQKLNFVWKKRKGRTLSIDIVNSKKWCRIVSRLQCKIFHYRSLFINLPNYSSKLELLPWKMKEQQLRYKIERRNNSHNPPPLKSLITQLTFSSSIRTFSFHIPLSSTVLPRWTKVIRQIAIFLFS